MVSEGLLCPPSHPEVLGVPEVLEVQLDQEDQLDQGAPEIQEDR